MEHYIRTRNNSVTSTLKPGYRNDVILKSGHSFGLDSNLQDNDNAPESEKKEEEGLEICETGENILP